jgi:hypothetical protein
MKVSPLSLSLSSFSFIVVNVQEKVLKTGGSFIGKTLRVTVMFTGYAAY